MKTTAEMVEEFFRSHPNETLCYEALGVIFLESEKEKAEKFMGGVAGRSITTHTRTGINYERESDRIKHELLLKDNEINQAQLDYEAAPSAEKEQYMSIWTRKKEEKLKIEGRLEKQVKLEAKEERIAKSEKAVPDVLIAPELTVEQLEAKVSAQQAVISSNEELIKAMRKGKKKEEAEVAQKQEIALLKSLEKQLKNKKAAAAAEPSEVDHIVTAQDLEANPALEEQGVKVGDTIKVPAAGK